MRTICSRASGRLSSTLTRVGGRHDNRRVGVSPAPSVCKSPLASNPSPPSARSREPCRGPTHRPAFVDGNRSDEWFGDERDLVWPSLSGQYPRARLSLCFTGHSHGGPATVGAFGHRDETRAQSANSADTTE